MTEATDTQEPGNDTLLAGKYKTPQELEKAYLELQKKLGQRPGAPPVAPLGGTPEVAEPDGNTAAAKHIAKFNTALAKLQAGDPAAEAELIAMGGDPRAIRMTLGYAQQTQRKFTETYQAPAGGKEGFEALAQWMDESPDVEPFERDMFATAMASGDIGKTTEAVKYMTNKHRESTGYSPAQLTHVVPGGGTQRVEGFADEYELGRAYAEAEGDPAKMAVFNARCGVSDFIGMGFVPGYQNHSASEPLPPRGGRR